jgi:branched-chain amino acid transport system ATP-binding protein
MTRVLRAAGKDVTIPPRTSILRDGGPVEARPDGSGKRMEPAEAVAGTAEGDCRSSALLSVEGVSIRFGGVAALDDVSFRIAAGTICGLIGPNGAGKTTLFNCISRLYEPQAGSIRFEGRLLSGVPRRKVAVLGIARTFQNLALFATMTTRDNVRVGAHALARGGFLASALRLPLAEREERRLSELADALIEEFGLQRVADRRVEELPFGLRKRVELARALAIGPKLLLLDEPAAGLNHDEVGALAEEIRAIRDRRGVAILLVEHHMNLVMRISDQVVALDFGRVIADGRPEQVRTDPAVVRAYLGTAR